MFKVWVIYLFLLVFINFLVKLSRGEWWGNCVWCLLGVVVFLDEDVSICISSGVYGELLEIKIVNGEV